MIHYPGRANNDFRCSEELLVLLSEDRLDDENVIQLTRHLDHCESCQLKLVQLSFDESTWSDTRDVILEEVTHRNNNPATVHTAGAKSSGPAPSLVRWLEPLAPPSNDGEQFIGKIDDYLIRKVIGHGGMGVVFEGWDEKLHRPIAIKAMHPHLAVNGTARQRFVRETRGAAAVVHPNVVAIHTVHAEHDPPYFVMPLIAGESLQNRIDRCGPLEIEACLRVAIQIADGLAAAHAQGLVHRDIKPANILLEHGAERALITDFGVVRVLNEAAITAGSVIAGTPEYMSPEQASGRLTDTRSDLFSLGSVMYAMLTGRPPFRADTALQVLRRIERDTPRRLGEIRPDVTNELEAIVGWLLEKQPEKRIDDAGNLAQDLRQLLAHYLDRYQNPIPGRLVTRMKYGTIRAIATSPKWLAATLLIVAAIVGAGYWISRSQEMKGSLSSPNAPTVPESEEHSVREPPFPRSDDLDRQIRLIDQSIRSIEKQLAKPYAASK